MVKRRTAKVKGNQMEYNIQDSLKPIYPRILLRKELGFYEGYDLVDDEHKIAIEAKSHARFTWNELLKYWKKLCKNAPEGYIKYLIFKSNRQPILVMFEQFQGSDKIRGDLIVKEFEDLFGLPFIKHEPRRKR